MGRRLDDENHLSDTGDTPTADINGVPRKVIIFMKISRAYCIVKIMSSTQQRTKWGDLNGN